MTEEELLPFCECGECGLRVTKKGNRFRSGHNRRGIPHTPETIAKMSAWQFGVPHTTDAQIAADEANRDRLRGIPHSPEHNDAIKKGMEESGAIEAMRGGNDLVEHHYIYDHSDLSLNTVQMTRSDHQSLHRILQKLDYIILHINQEVV